MPKDEGLEGSPNGTDSYSGVSIGGRSTFGAPETFGLGSGFGCNAKNGAVARSARGDKNPNDHLLLKLWKFRDCHLSFLEKSEP
jgi:hypothetical protein